jgi:SAM-dependent methyltransferase
MSEASTVSSAANLDQANAAFWDELCGSTFAQALGITDHTLESLDRFDEAYLDFYPYLLQRVGLENLAGMTVLEVGLGYGTLSQKLAQVAADYSGLDVAAGPVNMVNHRLRMQGLGGRAIQGSILNAPLPSASLDALVSIGCFHHTGDVQRSIDETYRLLKPGGIARIMVYNGLSYRQWLNWPRQTLARVLQMQAIAPESTVDQRAIYDANSTGEAAPETAFLSARQLSRMFRRYSDFACHKENASELPLGAHRLVPRKVLLPTLGKLAGLDLYIEARK